MSPYHGSTRNGSILYWAKTCVVLAQKTNVEIQARLEYTGDRKFSVSYMRHTEQWWEILEGLSLEECFEAIREQELLHP